jgi:hypothetical protein
MSAVAPRCIDQTPPHSILAAPVRSGAAFFRDRRDGGFRGRLSFGRIRGAEALVASCESRGVVRLDDGLEIGQKVRILSGPFAETICRLADLDDRGRVRVLLEIMGMEVAAQLDRSAIGPADRSDPSRTLRG